MHPFTTGFGTGDVRITTRFDPNFLNTALFGSLHEAGHAIYEQSVNPDFDRTPLSEAASLAIHESQSRMWENLVGRGRAFWVAFTHGCRNVLQSTGRRESGDLLPGGQQSRAIPDSGRG